MLKSSGVELRKYIARKGLFVNLPIQPEWRPSEAALTLGRAILDRAILDCFEVGLEEDTVDWFDLGNIDFTTICYLAMMPPEQVIERIAKVLDLLEAKEHVDVILRRHKERKVIDVKNV